MRRGREFVDEELGRPDDDPVRRRRPVRRGLIKLGAVAALAAVGIGLVGRHYYETNTLPSVVLQGLEGNRLPHEIDRESGDGSLICASGIEPCDAGNALGAMALRPSNYVEIKNISKYVPETLIASEDRRFLERKQGCDTQGIFRAGMSDTVSLLKHKLLHQPLELQGASTIERQTASLIYPKPTDEQLKHNDSPAVQKLYDISPSLARQAYECREALSMREVYPVYKIEEKYLNAAYFGRGATGIGAASQAYFNKTPNQLNRQEAAILVATLPEPSNVDGDVNPKYFNNPEQYDKYKNEMSRLTYRYNNVRGSVIEMLSKSAKTALSPTDAKSLDIGDRLLPVANNASIFALGIHPLIEPFTPPPPFVNNFDNAGKLEARHYTDFVLDQAAKLLNTDRDGVINGSYKIYTCLNTKNQVALGNAISQSQAIKDAGINAAGVSLAPDGCIRAMVGGIDYEQEQTNVAVKGRRPGSSNKGFAAAVAIENGNQDINAPMTIPRQVIVPLGGDQKPWVVKTEQGCSNLGQKAPCKATLAEAVAVSSNTWAAETVKKYGIDAIVSKMDDCGMNVPKPYAPALILGATSLSPLQEAVGYNCLVQNKGTAISYDDQSYYAIDKIVDKHGETVYQLPKATTHSVFDRKTAILTIKALRGVTHDSYGTAYKTVKSPGGPMSVAGKTGTSGIGDSKDNSDLWFTASVKDGRARLGSTTSIWAGHTASEQAISNDLTSASIAEIVGRYIADPKRPHSNRKADIAK